VLRTFVRVCDLFKLHPTSTWWDWTRFKVIVTKDEQTLEWWFGLHWVEPQKGIHMGNLSRLPDKPV